MSFNVMLYTQATINCVMSSDPEQCFKSNRTRRCCSTNTIVLMELKRRHMWHIGILWDNSQCRLKCMSYSDSNTYWQRPIRCPSRLHIKQSASDYCWHIYIHDIWRLFITLLLICSTPRGDINSTWSTLGSMNMTNTARAYTYTYRCLNGDLFARSYS